MAQCSVDTVGAIIDRPARKFYEFALGFGEFAASCRSGRRIGAPTPNIAPPSKSVILSEHMAS